MFTGAAQMPRYPWERAFRDAVDVRPVGCRVQAAAVRAVGYALSTFAEGDGGSAWPGVGRLAAAAGVSVSTVRRSLAALQAAGWILQTARPQGRSGKAATWALAVPAAVVVSDWPEVNSAHPGERHSTDETALTQESAIPDETAFTQESAIRVVPFRDPSRNSAHTGTKQRSPRRAPTNTTSPEKDPGMENSTRDPGTREPEPVDQREEVVRCARGGEPLAAVYSASGHVSCPAHRYG